MFASVPLPGGSELRLIEPTDATAIAAALTANREYLAPWEPARPDVYFTAAWWSEEIARSRRAVNAGTMLPLVIARGREIVGRFTLGGITRGAFQSAGLGYWVAQESAGHGLASAAVAAIVDGATFDLGLHRIEASTLLHNGASQRVLEKAGFVKIGMAPQYLSIADRWQDHLIFQRLLH